jgi:hypothetical protein
MVYRAYLYLRDVRVATWCLYGMYITVPCAGVMWLVLHDVQVEAPEDIDVPDALLPEERIAELMEERKPHYIPVEGSPPGTGPLPAPDPVTGISRLPGRDVCCISLFLACIRLCCISRCVVFPALLYLLLSGMYTTVGKPCSGACSWIGVGVCELKSLVGGGG